MKLRSKILTVLALTASLVTGCSSDADTVSSNLSKDADHFKIQRRIVFYNGITGDYILEVTGLCSIGNNDDPRKLSVTCKVGEGQYKKHFLGLSDNVTFFAEQIAPAVSDPYHYKVVFRPEEIIPDVELQTSGGN